MMRRSNVLCGLLLISAIASAGVETTCFAGGAETGRLSFSGAVEDSEFTGRFGDFKVDYCVPGGAGPAQGSIEVTVDLASADSDNADRDQTLKGPEFFAVDRHPRAEWRSTAIEQAGSGYRADGELTLKAITRSQPIRFTLSSDGADLMARGEFTLAGTAEVDRQRFDIGTGDFADPEFVRNRVDVEFEVRLIAEAP